MISLIVGLVLFAIGFILIVILCRKGLHEFLCLILPVGIVSLFCFICCIVGNNMHINENNYLKLNFMAEHWKELSISEQAIIISDVKYWNENLNNGNNYWFKFKLEDRSMYYIELQK